MSSTVRIHADDDGNNIELKQNTVSKSEQIDPPEDAIIVVPPSEIRKSEDQNNKTYTADDNNLVVLVRTFHNLLYAMTIVTLLNAWVEGVFLVFAVSFSMDGTVDFYEYLHLAMGLFGGLYLYPVATMAPWCCFSRGLKLPCCCGERLCDQGCCGGCCGLFRYIGRSLLTTTTPFLLLMLPVLLVLASLLPVTASHIFLNNVALAVMYALAWRKQFPMWLLEHNGTLQASLVLSFAARAAFRSGNNFYWEMRNGWILILPLLISHAMLGHLQPRPITSSAERQVTSEDGKELTVITENDDKNEADLVEYEQAPTGAEEFARWHEPPTKAEEEPLQLEDFVNGAFMTFAFFSVVSLAASPAIIVRGSGLVPDGVNYTVPLIVWAVCIVLGSLAQPLESAIGQTRLHRDLFSLLQATCILLFLFLPEGVGSFVFGVACLPLASWTVQLMVKRLQMGRHRRVLRAMGPFFGPYVGVLIIQWFSWNADLGSYRLHLCTTWLCLLCSNVACFVVTPLDGNVIVPTSKNSNTTRKVTFVLLCLLGLTAGLTNSVTPSPPPENDGTMVISAWNIQRLYPYSGTGNGAYRIIEYMNNHDMGLVALQESESMFPLVGSKDTPHLLAAGASMNHFYGENPLLASFNGCSMLSRYKLKNCEGFPFAQSAIFPTFTGALCEVVGLEQPLIFMSVHATLTPPTDARKSIDIMMKKALSFMADGYEVVLAGDLNLAPDHPDMQPFFLNGFKSATQEYYMPEGVERSEANHKKYIPPSRPASGSIVDYVLYSPGLELVEAEVVTDTQPLSDHVLVQATLQWVSSATSNTTDVA